VIERGDFLVLLKDLLFILLILRFCSLGTLNGGICLSAKSSKFLRTRGMDEDVIGRTVDEPL